NDRATHTRPSLRQEKLRWISHLTQPLLGHLKHTDFISRPKAIFHTPQDPEMMSPLTLEIQDRVHHMLQNTRPCDGALLGHMPHQDNHHLALLGQANELLGTRAYLANRARR